MKKPVNCKIRVNKTNGQISISLPKKKFEKNFINELKKKKQIKLFDWGI